jgi:hypothetical protein
MIISTLISIDNGDRYEGNNIYSKKFNHKIKSFLYYIIILFILKNINDF